MYENYYGLNSKPFQLTPDPSFFFASKWHKRAMSYLQYGLSQAEGFIVITGDIGTGKTTIANSLLDGIADDIVAAQIVTPKLNPDELVKMVASKFSLDVAQKTKADILQDLERYLFDLHKIGKRALLIVDEAQNLPLETIEELRMLSNFQQGGKPLLQSFLLGQDELQPILRAPNMEQFRQRIVASCHLAPLTDTESKEYIEFRMTQAGWNRTDLLSAEAYDRIYQFTHGVPRKINTLMDRILLYGFLEELEALDENAVELVIKEVAEEMFVPTAKQDDGEHSSEGEAIGQSVAHGPVKDVQYYKTMLTELTDALDTAISHKIKLTRYIDNLLKKKYKTYVRLKSDD
jgi:general secretion pathway protein A